MIADIWTPTLARRRHRPATLWPLIRARRRGGRVWASALLVLGVGVGGCAGGGDGGVAEPPLAVRVANVEHRRVAEVVEAVATVSARHEVTLLARLAGTVAELPLPEGAILTPGVLLARIEASDLTARLERAQAEAARAVGAADFACDRYAEDVSLAARGIVSMVALAQSDERCRSAGAAADAGMAAVREIGEIANRRDERAPGRGLLLRRLVEPGQHVMPGTPLALVADDGRELRVQLGADDLARGVAAGTTVRWRDAAGAATGTVREIGPVHQGPGRTSTVRIDPSRTPTSALGAGMSVSFILHEEEGIAVPATAVRRDHEGEAIFLIEAEHAVHTPVRTRIAADGWAIVEPPPAAGSRVAVGSLARLRGGRSVYAVAAGDVR